MDEQQKEVLFAGKLNELKKQAIAGGRMIAKQAVMLHFAEMEFNDTQLELVYDYLKKQGIEVLDSEGEDSDKLPDADNSDQNSVYSGTDPMRGESNRKYSPGGDHPTEVESPDRDLSSLKLTGTREAMEAYIVDFVSVIGDIARLYEGQGVLKEDLVGEGTLAAFEATVGLKGPADGGERQALENHLAGVVMGAMERLVGENLEQKDIEQNVLDRVKKVSDAATELSDVLRRKVSVEELLREEEELTEEEIRLAIRLSGGSIDVK